WALPGADPERQGAKAAQQAVPAGSLYYFAADDEAAARQLAEVLNWHGPASHGSMTINHRRSTLLGEKGFGLGACATWQPFTPKSAN
ncbi:MAG: hypothetical protein ACFB21_15805, partial [Opitutales bacterium]